MRRVTRQDFRDLYEPVPKELADDIHAALAPLPERRQGKMKRKFTGLLIAAVLLALSAAGIAAAKLNLFSDMTDSANPIVPLEGAENLIETNLGSVENEWATVTVEQAAYDGQGVNVLARITPKRPEEYALFNSWMMDRGDMYDVSWEPDEVETGTQESNIIEGGVKIVNENGAQAYYEAGKEVPIPEGREAAMAAGCMIYREDGKLYYTYQDVIRVKGRKDGKRIVGFDMGLRSTSNDPAQDASFDGIGGDAEEQSDGSVLVWFDGIAERPLSDEIELELTVWIWPNGEEDPSGEVLETIAFKLKKSEAERVARYVPEDGGMIGDHVKVREVNVSFTKVRAYLTVDYDYEEQPDEVMGVWLHPYDGEGNPIHTGSGGCYGPDEGEKLGFYRQQDEMQSFDAIPDVIVLEAKVIDGDPLGRVACRLAEGE